MKSRESEKCQTPIPTTEHASVVLGVWKDGKAQGIAENGQEGQAAHQWRDAARRRGLGGRSADLRPSEGAWQYWMAPCRPDPVGSHLGMVERYHPDRSVRRIPSLVDGRA